MRRIFYGGWSITIVCAIIGFVLAVQFRQVRDSQAVPNQPTEIFRREQSADDELKFQAGVTALEGEGVIVKLDDSARVAKLGENPNLYLIHDDDLLRVINELRAAGAEAISINGQRLIATSEIRCAGPTLSVNNVRSSAPYEIRALGDKTSLENSITMRGGVADTLKVWGIELEIIASDNVYIPAYKGTFRQTYSRVVDEK